MISIQNLSYTMADNPVLSGFSMCIKAGEKVRVKGRSGSGKTSLFRLLLGFNRPDKGVIRINGLSLDRQHIKEIRNRIFYLSQDVDLPQETGRVLIERLNRINKADLPLMKSLDRFLRLLDLTPNLLNKNTAILSGGERQRLGLLIGLLLNRPIWLLDEPTSALDDTMKERVIEFLTGMGSTMLIVSHDRVWEDHPLITTIDWR